MTYDIAKAIKFVQKTLDVPQTGIADKAVLDAIDTTGVFKQSELPPERKIIGYLQHIMKERQAPIKVDGFYGEQTDYMFNAYLEFLKNAKVMSWRTDGKSINSSANATKGNHILPTYAEISSVYGRIEDIKSNIVEVLVPYPHYLAWNPTKQAVKVKCHKLVADRYRTVLEEVLEEYGQEAIVNLHLDQFGGCFSDPPRKMRGGNLLSVHSWGIAFDYDPIRNQLKMDKTVAEFARAEYDAWRRIWRDNGAVSLGEVRDYDWMHFQLSKA